MEIKIFTQTKGNTDSKNAVKYIDEQSSAKLAIIYSSIRNDEKTAEYFNYLADNLKTPFIAVRVGGTYTREDGYCEDAVSTTVFRGEIDAAVYQEKIDYSEPEKTAQKIIPNLKNTDLVFVYSATHAKKLAVIDYILRKTQNEYPDRQVFGGGSAPKAMVATKTGVFEDSIVFAKVNGIKHSFNLDTGFKINETQKEKIIITKADDFHIYEINNKNAAEEYCRIQHMRPYYFNMMSNMLSKPSPGIVGSFARTTPAFYEGVMKTVVEIYGTKKTGEDLIRPIGVMEIDEEKGRLIVENKKPEGSDIKRLLISKNDQLEVYDKIIKETDDTSFLFLNACIFTPFWFDFDFEEVGMRLVKIKKPFILNFFFGEYGAKLPYKKDINVVNTCVVETLAIK